MSSIEFPTSFQTIYSINYAQTYRPWNGVCVEQMTETFSNIS